MSINLDTEKTCALSASEIYDIIRFACQASNNNGFVSSYAFEHALYVFAIIYLYPDQYKQIIEDDTDLSVLDIWEELLKEGMFDNMLEEHPDELNAILEAANLSFDEYVTYSHSMRSLMEGLSSLSEDLINILMDKFKTTVNENNIQDILEIANNWGMTATEE